MSIHYLHHGGAARANPNREMYPSAAPQPGQHLAAAAHKEPVAFSIARMLDFSPREGRAQLGFQRYLERLKAQGDSIKVGDTLVLAPMPARSMLIGWAWGVEVAQPGVKLALRTLYSNVALGSPVDASAVASDGGFAPAISKWLHDSDFLVADVLAWPAGLVEDLQFWAAPIVLSPKVGN